MNKYIPPAKAYRQLTSAYELGNSVYIYGDTGYGKTRMVQQFLCEKRSFWFQAKDNDWDFAELNINDNRKQEITIVFDDIQYIYSRDRIECIISYIKRENTRVILIGRIRSPQWLMPLIADGLVSVISESKLHMTAGEINKLANQNGITLSKERCLYFEEFSEGNAFAISTAIQLLKNNDLDDSELRKTVIEYMVKYLEQEIITEWDMYIQEFLMIMSVVDEFTLPMTVMITGDDQAAMIIEKSLNCGNFLFAEGETYHLKPVLLKALRSRALKFFGLNEYRRYIANAAHYYEMQDDILTALELYKKAECRDNIRALLLRNSRRHPGAGHYYELRKYYFELEDKDIENTPILMSTMSMLYSILMNPDKSEYWYKKLQEYSKTANAGEKREINGQLIYLDIALPHRGIKDLTNIIKNAFSIINGGGMNALEVSITNNGPSAMNGGKDFCEWSKKDRLLASTIGKIVETVLGDAGRGLVHAALCESIYEKGEDDAEVLHHALIHSLDTESICKNEMLFISIAIQTRLSVITFNASNVKHILSSFEKRIQNDNNQALKNNFDAFKCQIALSTCDTEYAKEWLRSAPDELMEFCTIERYRYVVKALCYVQFGMNKEAIDILNRLRYYAEAYQRNYIHMETGLLLSIVLKRKGEEWEPFFLQTILEIQEYKFVRIISEKGAGILPLLKELKKELKKESKKESKFFKKIDLQWFTKVISETETVAKNYPGYLNCSLPQISDFNEVDIKILKLQAKGISTKEIANMIFMSERNVKYHVSENYKKLGAKGKVEAVQIAKSINLI